MLPRSKISSRRTLQVGDNLIRGRSELRMQELAVRLVGRFIRRCEKRKNDEKDYGREPSLASKNNLGAGSI